jgi:hypothetical protein
MAIIKLGEHLDTFFHCQLLKIAGGDGVEGRVYFGVIQTVDS